MYQRRETNKKYRVYDSTGDYKGSFPDYQSAFTYVYSKGNFLTWRIER